MKVVVEIDGTEITDPLNLDSLEFEVNFDPDSNYSASVSISELELGVGDSTKPNDGYNFILDKVNKSILNQSIGVEEALPVKIKCLNERGQYIDLFKGNADMWSASYRNGSVTLPIIDNGRIDWLSDQLDSVSFEYLYSIGKITSSDFIQIPYCINKQSNNIEVIITLLSLYTITEKIQEQINAISELLVQATNPFEFSVIGKIALKIAYLTLLFASMVTLLIDLYNMIIQPVKYHNGMNVFKMLNIAMKHLGYQFQSSILSQFPYNKLYVLPEKYQQNVNNDLRGLLGYIFSDNVDETGYYNGTVGDLFRDLKTLFNARTIISAGVVYFEPYNFTLSSPIIQLPDTLDSRYEFEFNYLDFYATTMLAFQTDLNDFNTIQEYSGTSIEVIQEPIVMTDIKRKLTKNAKILRSQFSLGKRKTELSFPEKILSTFYDSIGLVIEALVTAINILIELINALIDLVNSIFDALSVIGIDLNINIPNIPIIEIEGFKNPIKNRIGMLKMENDFVSIPKLLLLDDMNVDSIKDNKEDIKLLTNSEVYLNAGYIYENYHVASSFVPDSNGKHNQYLIKSFNNIPFSFDELNNVISNNRIYDAKGNECILTSLKFNPIKQVASGTYKQNFQYIYNIKETKLYPNA